MPSRLSAKWSISYLTLNLQIFLTILSNAMDNKTHNMVFLGGYDLNIAYLYAKFTLCTEDFLM